MQSSGFLRVLLFSLKSARVRAYVSERTQEQRSDGRLLRRAGGRVGGCRRPGAPDAGWASEEILASGKQQQQQQQQQGASMLFFASRGQWRAHHRFET